MTRIATLLATTILAFPAIAETAGIEKDELTLGFIKLTDMAPLAIAKEKGFFEDEGLSVTLTAQSNWKVLLTAWYRASWTGHTCWQASRLPPPSAMAPRPRL